jgi:hypothetical protein
MKKQARIEKRRFWRTIFDRLKLTVKIFRRKFALKKKSFQRFPNEAPH